MWFEQKRNVGFCLFFCLFHRFFVVIVGFINRFCTIKTRSFECPINIVPPSTSMHL